MHEWALSDSVAAAALEVKTGQNLKTVDEITVVLGAVQDIAAAAFAEIFDEVKKNYRGIENARLIIETEPAEFICLKCGNTFGLEREKLDHETGEAIHFLPEMAKLYIKCGKCNSPDFKITRGRGVYIKEIKGGK
ncbi:MAG: hydrogenase/urease maturation nickel metallochaperone HypA [Elusimicrobiota bacterium]|jgi:hydrogenase nickel incorporation protein HypA/HybF|nr:hydrogenase/urease maturation nickel metallochaperone HypA [Elusimicrobiota bacterium]